MEKGIVSKTYGSLYGIRPEGEPERELQGSLRGRLRLQKEEGKRLRQRHPLSIGDHVSFSFSNKGKNSHEALASVSIEEILPRENSLERFHRNRLHCLGANLKRAIVIVSLESPPPHFGFVDRFLCAAYLGNVRPWILFSKRDLYEKKHKGAGREDFFAYQIYKDLGYRIFWLNLEEKEDLEELKKEIYAGITIFLGQSGVGKSTLLNQLMGKDTQKINSVSASTGQGRHTSTNASLFFHASTNSCFIDTPGLREWGLRHYKFEEILSAFPEIRPAMKQCAFPDCSHQNSADSCAVRSILNRSREAGQLSEDKKEGSKAASLSADSKLLHPSRLHSLENILASLSPDTAKVRKNKNKRN